MNEVSCQVLDMFFHRAIKEGIPLSQLTDGVPYSLAHLSNRFERMDWNHFVRFMSNAGKIWSEEELYEFGIHFFRDHSMKSFAAIARILFSIKDFYRWIFGESGMAGTRYFSCVDPTIQELDSSRLLLRLQIRPGFDPCPEFFLVSKGNFAGMPKVAGLELAHVVMECDGMSARYEVFLPKEGGWMFKVRKAIALPFNARKAALELEETRTQLENRHADIAQIRAGLDQRTQEVEAISAIGHTLASHTNLDDLGETVVELLMRRFGFADARLWMAVSGDFVVLKETRPGLAEPTQSYPLVYGGDTVGRLDVWVSIPGAATTTTSSTSSTPTLNSAKPTPLPIEGALPWIAMALRNLRAERERLTWQASTRNGTLGAPSIADYTLLKVIGRGAYGEVWLARNIVGVHRAVKVLYRSKFKVGDPYEREFRAVKHFMPVSSKHPGFVSVFHVSRDDQAGFFYYVMDLGDDEVKGAEIDPETYAPLTLASHLAKVPGMPVETCLDLVIQLGDALEYLHQQNLVHRDVKPSNVIFVNGKAKFADVGLVTPMVRAGEEVSRFGTPEYMAPEGPGTAVADVYGLGKLLYVIGMGKKVTDYPELPTSIVSAVNNSELLKLNAIILKATAREPAERYQSAADMTAALREFKQSLSEGLARDVSNASAKSGQQLPSHEQAYSKRRVETKPT